MAPRPIRSEAQYFRVARPVRSDRDWQVKSGRDRLKQAQPWRRRKASTPDVADNDFGIGQQRSKPLRIALVLEDLGFQGRFQLGRMRGNACREMAEKLGSSFELFPVSYAPGVLGDRHSFSIDTQLGRWPWQAVEQSYLSHQPGDP